MHGWEVSGGRLFIAVWVASAGNGCEVALKGDSATPRWATETFAASLVDTLGVVALLAVEHSVMNAV